MAKKEPPSPFVRWNRRTGELVLENSALQLRIRTRDGLNPYHLVHWRTGRVYADADYCYGKPDAPLPQLQGEPHVEQGDDGSLRVTLLARRGNLVVQHTFRATLDALEEQLTLTNGGAEPIDLRDAVFGFTRTLRDGNDFRADLKGCCFHPIPYRRETVTGEFGDLAPEELLSRQGGFYFWSFEIPLQRYTTSAFGSEAWGWTDSDGEHTLLIAKYNPDAMEWSLLEAFQRADKTYLRFGGAGLWKLGDPEPAACLQPGQSVHFGRTRFEPCEGGWKGAFSAFRKWTESLGHRIPEGYDPPVHWNELYDNPLWWGADTLERRQQFYQLADMEAEAHKAVYLGCEALYLDPGWDTLFASSIWAEDRLGKQREFVRLLEERYGLRLALHNPLAAWCDVNGYPEQARRKAKDGQTLPSLCSASPAYLQTKSERLLRLCRDGASFLMYDGTMFTGECYDESHGHSLPLTRHEHCMALLQLIQSVKREFPQVWIELHDPIVGGTTIRYAPTYFLHALPDSFDELWGYEYMWDPMDDLRSGRALSLYYLNLAYSIPVYLHIDLRKDNEHALVFWWYASTCRHLGIGGRHPDPRVWYAHKQAMQTYLSLKRFYTQGRFYGIDETVHAHTLTGEAFAEGQTVAVLNVFNLATTEVEREIRFRLGDIGLPDNFRAHFPDVPSHQRGGEVTLWVRVPALGHRLVEVRGSDEKGE
ncbi:MAG: hypothetical protein KatS3mg023_2680 [Armatimonadota bacterium]|nr:MAG: hypothetical protein KatS3mg023_2680 [Armatimonadota bacterium]